MAISGFMTRFVGTALGAILLAPAATAQDTVEVRPLTDRIVMVHVDEGFVEHHRRGQRRNQATVHIKPLDVAIASRPATHSLRSATDPNYRNGRAPTDVGRKSKGTDFAWFVDNWVNNRAVNERPDHTKEHWLYLTLPTAMRSGSSYTLTMGPIAPPATFVFDERKTRSEAVRVNNLGYAPWIPAKVGYVFHWMGDRGGLDLSAYEGKRFWIVDQKTGRDVYEGTLRLRARADNQETAHVSDTPPHGSFVNADVYECEFSLFNTPGEYVLAVESIGCSFPFKISDDAYRPAFVETARALYHNRSGIELKRPFTEFVRPAPHHPRLTPGFAGRLQYTTVRFQEWGSEGGSADALQAGFKGPLDAWGWYQDAGDWDGYPSHFRVGTELLLAFRLAPGNFRDGDLNIPESGNGIPDIVDEAAWLPRFGHRLRQELLAKGWGTGGVGMRVAGDAFGGDTAPGDIGRGSWEDVDRFWVVSGEDPVSTFRYAAVAACLASALQSIGKPDPEGVDWVREAREAYAWAVANTRPGDEGRDQLKDHRTFAAAALFVLTGEKAYEDAFAKDVSGVQSDSLIWGESFYGPAFYALNGKGDPELLGRIRSAVLATAENSRQTAERRALRFGGNFFFPMLVGQQTTPLAIELGVGYALTRAPRYLSALATTADYFLGANNLGITWITGVGPRSPKHVFHMDAWYNTHDGRYHPGLIPYGPWRKESDEAQGPWDVGWPHRTVYPPIDRWPGSERWFDNRNSPLNSEFTVHQNIGPAAAFYGLLIRPW
ncbi:MAG: glycoside hydrolase family 9 protein [Fimbriimonadaceae bacterium]